MAKISVVIPGYNGLPHIKNTIVSTLQQTEKDFELIYVDDKSSDQSLSMVYEYANRDKRIKVFENEENLGMAKNWNKAIQLASGKYVKVLCSDDIIYSDCLEKQASILDQNKEISLVTSPSHVINAQGRILLTRTPLSAKPTGKSKVFSFQQVLKESIRLSRNLLGEPSITLFRREDIERCGLFDDAYRYGTDLEYWFRLISNKKLGVTGGVLAGYRLHPGSLTNTVMKKGEDELAKIFTAHSKTAEVLFDEARFRRNYQKQVHLKSTIMKIADIGIFCKILNGLDSLRLMIA